jgi:hypothetical protein
VTFTREGADPSFTNNVAWSFANPSAPIGRRFAGEHNEYGISAQLQIGQMLFPDREMTSMAEIFYYLAEATDAASGHRSLNITPERFVYNNFVIGINTNKIPQVKSTATSTRSVDAVTIRLKGLAGGDPNARCFITFLFCTYISLSERGVAYFD